MCYRSPPRAPLAGSRAARTCIHNQLDAVPDGAVGHRRRLLPRRLGARRGVVGCRHGQGADQERSGAPQVGEERGQGRGRGPLVRSEPGGGEEGAGAHDGGAGQTVEELASVDQPGESERRGENCLVKRGNEITPPPPHPTRREQPCCTLNLEMTRVRRASSPAARRRAFSITHLGGSTWKYG